MPPRRMQFRTIPIAAAKATAAAVMATADVSVDAFFIILLILVTLVRKIFSGQTTLTTEDQRVCKQQGMYIATGNAANSMLVLNYVRVHALDYNMFFCALYGWQNEI